MIPTFERTTWVDAHWAAAALHVALWSPELELGVWISSHPNHSQRYHYFAAEPPGALAFLAHPDEPTEQRLRRWTREYGGFALRAYNELQLLLGVAHDERGYRHYAAGRDATGEITTLRTDADALRAMCLRDADCGRGWTDHTWLLVDHPDDAGAEVFHVNLNSGTVVPPTPVLLW